jgi:diketogulonate reductase-like aldo/keto reductase
MAGAAKLRTFQVPNPISGRQIPELAGSLKSVDKCSLFLRGCAMELQWRCRTTTATIEYGACLIATAEEYRTEEIAGKAIEGQRDGVLRGGCLGISRGATEFEQHHEQFGDLAQIMSVSIIQLPWPYPRIPIEEPMSVLVGLTLYAKGRPST